MFLACILYSSPTHALDFAMTPEALDRIDMCRSWSSVRDCDFFLVPLTNVTAHTSLKEIEERLLYCGFKPRDSNGDVYVVIEFDRDYNMISCFIERRDTFGCLVEKCDDNTYAITFQCAEVLLDDLKKITLCVPATEHPYDPAPYRVFTYKNLHFLLTLCVPLGDSHIILKTV